MLIEGRITSGHARALLAVTDPSQQIDLAKKVEQERMSVREVEKAVKLLGKEKKEEKKTPEDEAGGAGISGYGKPHENGYGNQGQHQPKG